MKILSTTIGLGLLLASAAPAMCGGFEKLSKAGPTVLTNCGANACKVSSLPGESGYTLVAYFWDSATKPLKKAGRTIQGLNEYEEDQPERDNTWVDFRIDANAAELSGPSSARSPWLLTKTKAPTGYALNAFGLRVLNSDVEDEFDRVDFYTTSYQPNGVPPPPDDDDGEDDEG